MEKNKKEVRYPSDCPYDHLDGKDYMTVFKECCHCEKNESCSLYCTERYLRTEDEKYFRKAQKYFMKNGDLFTQSQVDFLMNIEYLWKLDRATQNQKDKYITMVNVVKDHEATLKKRYRD